MFGEGQQIAHYTILSTLGAGGMGEVYLAMDSKLERRVALKVLLPDHTQSEERVRRFMQEARAASALNHPNILTVFETGSHDELHYIATELIAGETLRERMLREPLKLGDALDIVMQVAAALGAAHEAGIVHRDLKPENIMVRGDGIVKVLDFGLAKLSVPSAESVETTMQINTQPGVLVGTVAYMSPEQAKGRRLDPRSDIFSLGIVMFELFTGRRPFDGESNLDLVSSILKDDPPSLCQVVPGLPRQLERIVTKSLRKDTEHRYQNVKDLYIDIEDLKEELKFEAKLNKEVHPTITTQAVMTDPSVTRSAFRTGLTGTRRFTLLHALLFFGLAGIVVAGIWYLARGDRTGIAGGYRTDEVASWNSAAGELFSSAKFSPDGKMIAFSSTRSGNKNIWVTQTGSAEALQITNDEFANTDPVWSPKGDEVAYVSGGGSGKPQGIWRVSALGGTTRLLGTVAGQNAELRRWAPSAVYYEADGNLYSMDIATGQSRMLTSFDRGAVRRIDISADERSIVYAEQKDDTWTIRTRDIADGQATDVVSGSGTMDGLVWLPEKKLIFYGRTVDGVLQVFRSDTSGTGTRQITASETDCSVVDASADGRSILFSSAKEESNLWRVGVTERQEAPVVRDLNAKLWPAVSPDDQKVAYQSIKNLSRGNRLTDSTILVKSLKGRDDAERPTMITEHAFLPAWAPDGTVIAFLRSGETGADLYLAGSQGGGERRLTTGGVERVGYSVSPYNATQTNAFAWSPDGQRIAFVSVRGGLSDLFTVTREGTETQVTHNTDRSTTYACPIWSSDGRRLAYSTQKKGDGTAKGSNLIGVADLEAGTDRTIVESKNIIRLIGWSAAEDALILAEASRFAGLPPQTILYRISLQDGKETEIAELNNTYFYNIFLSADRRAIAYAARNDSLDDIWIIPSAGGTPRKISANNDSELYFSRLAWYRDGSAVVFGKQTRFSLLSIVTNID